MAPRFDVQQRFDDLNGAVVHWQTNASYSTKAGAVRHRNRTLKFRPGAVLRIVQISGAWNDMRHLTIG